MLHCYCIDCIAVGLYLHNKRTFWPSFAGNTNVFISFSTSMMQVPRISPLLPQSTVKNWWTKYKRMKCYINRYSFFRRDKTADVAQLRCLPACMKATSHLKAIRKMSVVIIHCILKMSLDEEEILLKTSYCILISISFSIEISVSIVIFTNTCILYMY